MTNDQADYYSGITSITVNGKNAYELKGKSLDDLHKNAFSGTNGEVVTMDIFTKGALWDYWKLGSDEIELTNDETSDLEETDHDDEQEINEIFRIETNLFDYENRFDSELKEEAVRNKAIMEGLIDEDVEPNYEGWKSWDDFENTNGDRKEREWELFDNHKLSVCNIRRFKMIKYAFGDDEEYVAVKEDEYDDLTSTSKDACRAYQEIFRMMNKDGW
ncbi:hypothetical protein Tco_0762129 [Tanacetum coccineum]